jgi:hypothetical protein
MTVEGFLAKNALVGPNTNWVNFFDLRAISLPLPRDGGLPVGLMLVARNGHDHRLFRIAAAVEQLFAALIKAPTKLSKWGFGDYGLVSESVFASNRFACDGARDVSCPRARRIFLNLDAAAPLFAPGPGCRGGGAQHIAITAARQISSGSARKRQVGPTAA